MTTIPDTKNLNEVAPRSPKTRLGNYVILARAIDKCRADLAGQSGNYHFDCPLDNVLFSFKEIKGADLKVQVVKGLSDDQLVAWVNQNGKILSEAEIKTWSDAIEVNSLYATPEKRAYFIEECSKLGLNPEKTTTFEWLDIDDQVSFQKAA